MRFPRPTAWMAVLAALFVILPAHATPKPRVGPAFIHYERKLRHPIVSDVPVDSCALGRPPTATVGTLDFLFPTPGEPDVYYTLLRVRQCPLCSVADTAVIDTVYALLNFQAPCTLSVSVGMVRAIGTLTCPRPDSSTLICPPTSYDIVGTEAQSYIEAPIPLNNPCIITGNAFMVMSIIGFSSGCVDVAPNPAPRDSAVRITVSDSCRSCTSYNDVDANDDLNDFCDFGENNPIMYAAIDTCFPLPDFIRPGPILDLAADTISTTESRVPLRWTATGDDSLIGRPFDYLIRASSIDPGAIRSSTDSLVIRATRDPGGTETATFTGLRPATRYWFAVVARDERHNPSALSNATTARTILQGPLAGVSGPAVAARAQPAKVPVEIDWRGVEGGVGETQVIRIYDLNGRMRRELLVGSQKNGVVDWDGQDDDGHTLHPGVYFAKFTSGGQTVQARVVLIR